MPITFGAECATCQMPVTVCIQDADVVSDQDEITYLFYCPDGHGNLKGKGSIQACDEAVETCPSDSVQGWQIELDRHYPELDAGFAFPQERETQPAPKLKCPHCGSEDVTLVITEWSIGAGIEAKTSYCRVCKTCRHQWPMDV